MGHRWEKNMTGSRSVRFVFQVDVKYGNLHREKCWWVEPGDCEQLLCSEYAWTGRRGSKQNGKKQLFRCRDMSLHKKVLKITKMYLFTQIG